MIEMFKIDKKGRVRVWSAGIKLTDKGEAFIYSSSGLLDGAMKKSRKQVYGKNIGKANETTSELQATLSLQSMIKKKEDEGYRDSVEEANNIPKRPMLAVSWESRREHVTYPMFVQPKLDGVRCLAKKEGDVVVLYSRNGKIFDTIPHINEAIAPLLEDGAMLDGEIYVHGWSFQKIISALKAINEDTPSLQYWVYDIPMEDVDCETRMSLLQQTFSVASLSPIKYTLTDMVDSEDEVDGWLNACEEQDFEGVMLRGPASFYEFGYRSQHLIKVKNMQQGEYKIVNHSRYVVYIGNHCWEQVSWVCVTEDGMEFEVVPRGSYEERSEMLKHAEEYYGKMLIVNYQELSEDGVPRFPIGVSVRDYE